MKIRKTSSHRVEIHQSDLAKWFEANKKDIDTSTIRLAGRSDGLPGVCLVVPVSDTYLDQFLQKEIKDLPRSGYVYEVLPHAEDVVGVITWNS